MQLLLPKLRHTVHSRGWGGDETMCETSAKVNSVSCPAVILVNIQSMSASLVDLQWMFGESFIMRSTWGFGSRPGLLDFGGAIQSAPSKCVYGLPLSASSTLLCFPSYQRGRVARSVM